ncbi:MAG: RIP metalloprotease [Candidatus Zixiibacteriota bacterium]
MLSGLISVLSFIVLLGALIFIHELGHFLTAKKVGIRVDRFSLGFPPNIFSKKWRGTEYCVGIVPLGGYVKMAGESPDEARTGRPDEFSSKSVFQRFLVIFAGPFMNYALAIVLFSFLLLAYGVETISDTRSTIGRVTVDSPADRAGLMVDDIIIAVQNQPVRNFDSLRTLISPRAGMETNVVWLRGSDTVGAIITPAPSERRNQEGGVDTVGQIGVLAKVIYEGRLGFFGAVSAGFGSANRMVGQVVLFVKGYVSGEIPATDVGGPIYIARESANAAREGFYRFLLFMAMLSVNLAVLNILPIPVLDGGHLLFLLVEMIKGSPVSMKARMYAQQVGIVFLLVFILFVSWNDVARLLTG